MAMWLALHHIRGGDLAAATARWAHQSLQTSIDHARRHREGVDTAIPIIKRRAPAEAAVLLGALHAYTPARTFPGTQVEVESEARYESSLRRALAPLEALLRAGRGTDQHEIAVLATSNNSRESWPTSSPATEPRSE